MKKQNLLAIITIGLLLVISSILSQRAGGQAVQLRLQPSEDAGSVLISLINRGKAPVEFYDSLNNKREGEAPGLTSVRLRDDNGEILLPRGAQPDGFWTRDYTQTKRLPVVLDTLAALATVEVTTGLDILLEDFPEPQLLQRATWVQVRCAVFLDKGVLDETTDWIPLSRRPELDTER